MEETDKIKAAPGYLGQEGIDDIKKLKLQNEKLAKTVQKRKDACMDMLQFFQEKLEIKTGFAQLLNDIGVNQRIFIDFDDKMEQNQMILDQEMADMEDEASASSGTQSPSPKAYMWNVDFWM